jgi:hypothetical protein
VKCEKRFCDKCPVNCWCYYSERAFFISDKVARGLFVFIAVMIASILVEDLILKLHRNPAYTVIDNALDGLIAIAIVYGLRLLERGHSFQKVSQASVEYTAAVLLRRGDSGPCK